MHFRVEHVTHYSYDVPVTLGPHLIRLLPQLPPDQLKSRTLHVSPQPMSEEVTLDANGNTVLRVEFVGSTQEFSCQSRFEAHTTAPIPAVDAGFPDLPWAPEPGLPPDFYQRDATPEVSSFAAQHAIASESRPLAFLTRLNQHLFATVDRHIRPTGDAQSPQETLSTMRGACRDITTLFLALCRAQGIAARFVSGYQFAADTPDGQRHLHAWPEVFLPGYGWQGYDPTHGTAVGDGHVALCRAPEQLATMPVEGGFTFTGTVVNSTLRYSVHVETLG